MKKPLISFAILLLSALGARAAPASQKAIAVSPGDGAGAVINETCPTFSWSSVADAAHYELEIYRVGKRSTDAELTCNKVFPGTVQSWTPSVADCLDRGYRYAWIVRGIAENTTGIWSEPALFQVQPRANRDEFEEALAVVRRYLAETERPGQIQAEPEDHSQPKVPHQATVSPNAPSPAAPATAQLRVDGGIEALSFTGDGSALTNVVASDLVGTAVVSESELDFDPLTNAEMSTHEATADAHHEPPTTLPPSGAAGGDLTGTYPNPLVSASIARDSEVTSAISTHAGESSAHHTPPTSLPPSGAAGGDLSGTYPNPSVAASIARDSEVSSAISSHAGNESAHHSPTVDTNCNSAACDGTSFTNLQWGNLANMPQGFSDSIDDACTVTTDESRTATVSCSDGSSLSWRLPIATRQISAARHHSCALLADSKLVCWGWDINGQSTAPGGSFDQIAAGGNHSCGVLTDGRVWCWGNNTSGQANDPIGTFTQISAGEFHNCGVKSDNSIACWGDNSSGESTPPGGSFTQVSAGGAHSCGLLASGSVTCWGDNSYGQSSAPGDTFELVSAGYIHTCGLKTDGSVACWGDNTYGESSPPPLVFTDVSAGDYYSCGVAAGGAVTCWGENYYGQASPPSGNFIAVDAGYWHTCAVRSTGGIACWGTDSQGQCSPPVGLR